MDLNIHSDSPIHARLPIVLALIASIGVANLFAATANSKRTRGIDPDTLALNTVSEPKLDQPGMVNLFNGHDLSGWTIKGGPMPFVAQDGIIVGKCDPAVRLNSFLATDKTYTDFIFTAEYRWEVTSNSGIMLRAATRPLKDGEQPQLEDRSLMRVFGLQCEIDSSPRRWTGGIYGEAMGGWKYPLSKETGHKTARAAIASQSDWNRLTIHAQGSQILTWVNGIPCANLTNNERTSGFIGLQVHRGEQGEIHWRNLRIKDLSK